MKQKLKLPALLLSVVLLCASCGAPAADSGSASASDSDTSVSEVSLDELFSNRDLDSSWSDAVNVTLADDSSSSDGKDVQIDGNVITITHSGTYHLSGSLTEGQIVVDADDTDKVQLVLDGVSVTCTDDAVLYVNNADKVFVTIADGSENTLCSAGAFAQADEKVDGAVFARCDLTLNGTGALTVNCDSGSGIVSKGILRVVSGTVSVTAGKHGVEGKDGVRIADGTLTLSASTDGIHASNDDDSDAATVTVCGGSISITCDSDGIDAGGDINITGGTFTVTAGDDGFHSDANLNISGGEITIARSYEGLEGAYINLSGGEINITSSDDGLNAAGGSDSSGSLWGFGGMDNDTSTGVTISGGTLTVSADGDGIDTNGSLLVSGGTVYVDGPTNSANGAIDYTTSGTITGGTVVALGAAGMAQNFDSDSTQGSVLCAVSGTTGSTISLSDSEGNVLAEYTAQKSFSCAVISAPGMAAGGTYTLTVDGESQEITLTDTIYTESGLNSMGMTGGFGGMQMQGGTQPDATQQPDAAASGEQTMPNMSQSTDGTKPDMGQMPDGAQTMPDMGQTADGTQPDMSQMPGGTQTPPDMPQQSGTTQTNTAQA